MIEGKEICIYRTKEKTFKYIYDFVRNDYDIFMFRLLSLFCNGRNVDSSRQAKKHRCKHRLLV